MKLNPEDLVVSSFDTSDSSFAPAPAPGEGGELLFATSICPTPNTECFVCPAPSSPADGC
jgi:hypothetical protein